MVFLAINRRLGSLRKLRLPDEHAFSGTACVGVSHEASPSKLASQTILIIGAGAFSAENA